jgi:hypothetical protein
MMIKTRYKFWVCIGFATFFLPYPVVALKHANGWDAQTVAIFIFIDMIIYIISFFILSRHLYYGHIYDHNKLQAFLANIYKTSPQNEEDAKKSETHK